MASPGRNQSYDTHGSPIRSPAASQYPFPVIESPQRQPSFARAPLKRGSTANSIASNDGRSSIAESGQNAISTLLQPPIIRTGLQPLTAATGSGYRAPTQKDIPPVALTNIPHVEVKAFHPYLAQVGSLYEAFQRAKNEVEAGDTALFHREKKEKGEEWEAVLSKKLQRPASSRKGSVSSPLASPVELPQTRRRSSWQKRQAVTPLSTIPSVYGEEDFHLENPRTFDVVSERSEIVRDPAAAPSGRKSLATNAILQEKLSWYMDTVEIHLISSISTASKSFFSALGSLRELHAEAEDSVLRIQKLRKELAKLDKEMAVDGLKVINLKQRRDNVRRLAEAIMQLEDIVSAVKHCEQMVVDGKIDGTIDELDNVERLMAGSVPSDAYEAQDLRRLRALEGAADDLKHLRLQVGRGYETRFHNSLLEDVRRHVSETDAKTSLERWGIAYSRPKPGQRRAPSAFPSYMNLGPDFRAELEKEMQGLSKARHTTPAVTSFRSLILREMKSTIRKQLPSSTDDDNVSMVSASTHGGRGLSQQEKSSILARNLRALDGTDWYQMLVEIYTNISENLRRLSVQVKVLLDITSTMDQPGSSGIRSPPLRSPDAANKTLAPQHGRARSVSIQAEMQQALDLSNLLGEAVDAAQAQITKVLRVRSQQNNDLTITEFIRYFTLNRLFADECEAISGRSGANLKSVVDGQIKDYITQFGNTQRQRLVGIMDSDRWDAKDFGEKENTLLDRIMSGSTADAQQWLESSIIWQPGTTANENGSVPNGTSGLKEKVRSAVIDEQKFILSDSPINLLETIEQFEHLATGIPGIGQEAASSLLDCLKLYNSRTNQLILGAGATRSAGLKNITTKHLALSSQGLSFIIALVPYIREFFRRHVPASSAMQSMTDFDKVKRLFQEHQQGIHEKLIDIMSGRCSIHVRTMQTIDWEAAARNNESAVSPYMETLTKETATLQKVLAKHLPEGNVMSIMIPVFQSYRKQLESAYNNIDLRSSAAQERLMTDAKWFESRISKLEGAGDLGTHIVNVVRGKPITERLTEPERSGAAPSTPEKNNNDQMKMSNSEAKTTNSGTDG